PSPVETASLEQQERLLNVLRDFPGRVGPGAGIGPLCLEIARAFCESFPASGSDGPVCAFYISFESMQLFLCMSDRQGNMVSRAAGCRPGPAPQGRSVPAEDLLRPLLDPPDAWGDLIDLAGYTCLPLVAGQRWVGGVLAPHVPGDPDPLVRTFCEVMAFALAASADSAHADRLAERLARSNRRLAETREALAQAQAFAAIGEMAAGAAHELNNPLAVISGRAQLIAQNAGAEEQKKAAEQIVRKAEEVSGIVLELMDFAQPVAPSPAQVDVAELLAEAKNVTASRAQPKAPAPVVDINVQVDCPPVWVDAGQIRDVLLELIGNARQAADGPVRIRLEAATESGSKHVLVQVGDDGPGMDEKVLASAFTPFFSHRPAGRRRGMGLPRARRCIQSHGGRMWIESRPGGGTTAFVTLPQAQREAPNR
ncbi:hypothetical protein LCGC14_2403920, partial [marine sediment metagenome]